MIIYLYAITIFVAEMLFIYSKKFIFFIYKSRLVKLLKIFSLNFKLVFIKIIFRKGEFYLQRLSVSYTKELKTKIAIVKNINIRYNKGEKI